MEKRNLSGVYFRCKEEDGSWGNRVFEDISEKEQDKILEGRSEEWLKSLVKNMADRLRFIGDQFDIVAGAPDEESSEGVEKIERAKKDMMHSMFEENDWAHMHDCILNATHETTQTSLSQTELEKLFLELPGDMQLDAFKYGMNDTPWRDGLYEWYQKNMLV